MAQLTLEQAATQYGENNGYTGIMEPLASAFTAGAEWERDRFIDLCIAVKSFIDCGKLEQWSLDHHKEQLTKLLEPLKDCL